MSKQHNSTPPQQPSGNPRNNPDNLEKKIKGHVPTMRNPPPPPPKKNDE